MSSSERFHKAAKDGLLAYLKDASKKDTNARDEDWMTPVLWAAFEGHLDALRLLCAKGGDPDRCDQFGNTALHLASAKGHLHCVEFLVKFGVNIYALDIDKHSAKDLAAINNREEILRYLDAAAARLEANDRKKAKHLREIAEKNCEKHMREYMKRQQKHEPPDDDSTDIKRSQKHAGHISGHNSKSTHMLHSLKKKIWSSHGNLSKPSSKENATQKFSDLVMDQGKGKERSSGGSFASKSGGILQQQFKSDDGKDFTREEGEDQFKICDTEIDGRRTVSSLAGGQQRDSEIMYVGTFNSNDDSGGMVQTMTRRSKNNEMFEDDEICSDTERESHTMTSLSRSFSQPDILSDSLTQDRYENDAFLQRPPGLFDRPMLGSIAFRRSITAALSQLNSEKCNEENDSKMGTGTCTGTTRSNSTLSRTTRTGSAGSKIRNYLNTSESETESEDDDGLDSGGGGGSSLQRFLTVWGLEEYLPVFEKQQIDLETLMLLTEADLKSLKSLPLGPFRKLTFAIQERKSALTNPGIMQDTCL